MFGRFTDHMLGGAREHMMLHLGVLGWIVRRLSQHGVARRCPSMLSLLCTLIQAAVDRLLLLDDHVAIVILSIIPEV